MVEIYEYAGRVERVDYGAGFGKDPEVAKFIFHIIDIARGNERLPTIKKYEIDEVLSGAGVPTLRTLEGKIWSIQENNEGEIVSILQNPNAQIV